MQSDLTQAELMAAFNAKRAELTSQGLGEALGLSKGLVRLIGAGQFGLLYIALTGHITPGLASLVIQTQVFFTIALAMS